MIGWNIHQSVSISGLLSNKNNNQSLPLPVVTPEPRPWPWVVSKIHLPSTLMFFLVCLKKKCMKTYGSITVLSYFFWSNRTPPQTSQTWPMTTRHVTMPLYPVHPPKPLSLPRSARLPQSLPSIPDDVRSHSLSSFASFARFGAFQSSAIIPAFHTGPAARKFSSLQQTNLWTKTLWCCSGLPTVPSYCTERKGIKNGRHCQ